MGRYITTAAKRWSVFGSYACPFQFDAGELHLAVEQADPFFRYSRECRGSRVEKVIASRPGSFLVHPVEPLGLPKPVTRFLEVRFPPLMVGPYSEETAYVTFPLDIGVFVEGKGDIERLDLFSLCEPAYSLYGPPDRGVITRYHESKISAWIPEVAPLSEGVLHLTLVNQSRNWIEISQVVFESTTMALFFDEIVCMQGKMDVFSSLVAETAIMERPQREGMKRSVGLFPGKKSPFVEQKGFLMEHGVAGPA